MTLLTLPCGQRAQEIVNSMNIRNKHRSMPNNLVEEIVRQNIITIFITIAKFSRKTWKDRLASASKVC